MIYRLIHSFKIVAGMSLLLITLTQCALPTMKQIDTTEDYRSLGYPDQRKIARDSRGTLYVTYRKKYKADKDTNYHIFVAQSTDNGASWRVLNNNKPIEQTGDYMQRVPTIAIDGRDVIHIAWYGSDAQNSGENQRQIKYIRSTDGGVTWTPWINVGEVQGYDSQKLWQEHPTLAVSGTNVYIAWQGIDPANPKASQVRLAHSGDSGAKWDAWQSINPTNRGNRSRPSIVATLDGRRLFILAYGGVGTPQQIVWTSSNDGGATWNEWQPVASNPYDQRHVSVALNGDGHVHALWRQMSDKNTAQIVYGIYDGKTWSQPVVVQASNANQFFPSIAVSGKDTVWATWTESNDAAGLPEDDPQIGSIVVAKKEADSPWRALEPPAPQGGVNMYSSLRWGEYNNGGNVDLVWLHNNGDQWQLTFSALSAWK
jgi:hypothetical protein